MDRRKFISHSLSGVLVGATMQFPFSAFANDPDLITVTILHTNDVHSRIDPFPMDGGRNEGLAGVAKRATIIEQFRKDNKNVLLFDSGDIFQGTPYYNMFGGELEIKLMSQMKYDAGTMGNHDFDGGIDGFKKQMVHADFPFIVSNYDFSDTILDGAIEKYKIFKLDGVKIGVLGVGIELAGLVPQKLYKKTRYLDPIDEAQKAATFLSQEKGCDYVICLSHLGFKYRNERISDVKLARMTNNIDLILGGHTHTFMKQPELVNNKDGKSVTINQCGYGGILLGHIKIVFEKNRKGHCVTCKNALVN